MISDRTRQRLAELQEYVSEHANGRWLVLTHDSPDPDAIASAVALGKLLRQHFDQTVTLAYGGIVGRAENQELMKAVKSKFSRVRHLNFRHYQHFALVDTQPRTGNNQLPDEAEAELVFDHHPIRKATHQSPFVDVRPEYGATASILAEYLLAAGLEPTKREATAIVYAIRTETLDFSRESPDADRALYDHLFKVADKRMLGRIQSPRLPLSYFSTLHDALENIETVDSLIVSHLGEVSQPDIVPEIADFLLRLEGKTWSLCTGPFEDRIYCSIRTTNPRANAAGIMRRLLGRRGKGGGHGMLAGGWAAAPDEPEQRVKLQRDLGRRLATLLRKKPDRMQQLTLKGESKSEPPPSNDPHSS